VVLVSERIDRAIAKSILAAEGAAIGGAIGGPAGATVGAVTGLIVGDQNMVFPIDMIAIPAYQAYMIQGVPAMQVYIKSGETLLATGDNADDVQETLEELAAPAPKRKRKSTNPWIVFNKKFTFRAKRKNESSQEYLRKRTKAARTAYNKTKKGGRK
jgi:hypothetical protein